MQMSAINVDKMKQLGAYSEWYANL